MAGNGGATAFVTGAAGFIGTELVEVLVARGHRVFDLTRSVDEAQRVRRAGAVPVMGDLLEPGQWQDEVEADWVFHLPPHSMRGPRVSPIHVRDCARALVHLAEYGENAVFSNIRLRGIGFHFLYPTLEQGIPQVLGSLHD